MRTNKNDRNSGPQTTPAIMAIAALTASWSMAGIALADTLLVPSSEYPTIQAALSASQAGDEIVIGAGVLSGPGNQGLTLPGFALTIRGETGDPADVVIEGPWDPYEGVVRFVNVPAGASGTRFEGLTIRRFTGRSGPGGTGGAAIQVNGAGVTFERRHLVQNSIGSMDCGEGGSGGAVYVLQATVRFVDCLIADNDASSAVCMGDGASCLGGGVYAVGASHLVFERCRISGNKASGSEFDLGSGGGVSALSPGSVTLVDSVVEGNTTYGSTANGAGVETESLLAINTDFIGNEGLGVRPSANTRGGAVAARTVVAIGCNFIDNQAYAWDGNALGGAVWGHDVTIVGGSIVGNRAGRFDTEQARGGGVHAVERLEMTNVVVAQNGVEGYGEPFELAGGGLHAAGEATLNNVTITQNAAPTGAGVYADAGSLGLTNSIVSNGFDWLAGPGTTTAAWSCITGGYPGEGNIDANPMLDAQHRPMPGSPVIDAGNTTLLPADEHDVDGDGDTSEPLPMDLAGLARAVDDPATPDTGVGSPVVDMGAYEVQSACRADFDGDGELTIFDFLAFQNAFDASDPAADFDGDGALTIFDFLEFQNEFDAGCA